MTRIWRPEGSKNILYMEKSDGFRWIGTLTTCSGCDSSIKRMKLFDRPMTRTSEEMTRETMGARGSNWTGSSSNMGVLTDSGPANWFPSYSEGKLTRQRRKLETYWTRKFFKFWARIPRFVR